LISGRGIVCAPNDSALPVRVFCVFCGFILPLLLAAQAFDSLIPAGRANAKPFDRKEIEPQNTQNTQNHVSWPAKAGHPRV
jgi:hypothetical protein